jgi:N-methylhydantoinase B
VIRNYLSSAADEMQRTLVRTAYNPVIYEMIDFGISIYDRELNLVGDSPGLSLFLGANDYGIQKGVEYVGEENVHPGDVIMLNYPYWSSAHTLDVCLFAPVFVDHDGAGDATGAAAGEGGTGDDDGDGTSDDDGELIGYTVVRAHWLGIGQKDDGYVLDSTSVHQEGILFPGTKVYKRGEPDEEIVDLLRFNTRGPNKIIGDLNAQIAAINVGKRRLTELHEQYGTPTVEACIDRILAHGEATARERVRDLPDGSWYAEDFVDNDAIGDEPVRIGIEATVDGDEFRLDFSGSAGLQEGPVNVPFGMTETVGKLVLKTLTTPEEPSNGGHYAPLEVIAPEGTLFHATYPAPTFISWPDIVGIDVAYRALAQGMPERVPAGSGADLCSVAVYGRDEETGHIFLDASNEGVGWGASHDRDGENVLMHVSESAIRNTPAEVFEARAPVRVERYELREDSGGAGEYRGGLGVRRDYRFTDDADAFTTIMKTRTPSWGLDGGGSGDRNVVVLDDLADDWDDRVELFVDNDDLYEPVEGPTGRTRKYTGLFRGRLRAGEVISDRTGGGGGYGDPCDRDPEAVRADVRDGYVSREAARDAYGVVLDDDGRIDREATERLRERREEGRSAGDGDE